MKGVWIPLITPLDEKGRVCKKSIARLLDFVGPYANGVIPCLSTGEGWKLSDEQWQKMVGYTRENTDLPVIPGILQGTTKKGLKRAAMAKKEGVQGIALSTPFGSLVSQEVMVEHYSHFCSATPLPILIYHENNLSQNTIETETMRRICQLPSIAGIKDSTSSPESFCQLLGLAPLFQGWEHLLESSAEGAGSVVSLANLEPEFIHTVFLRPNSSQPKRIKRFCETYQLHRENWYAFIKKELKRRGILSTAQIV